MKNNTTIIRKYADAKPELKIDIVCRYYPQLDSIIDAFIPHAWELAAQSDDWRMPCDGCPTRVGMNRLSADFAFRLLRLSHASGNESDLLSAGVRPSVSVPRWWE